MRPAIDCRQKNERLPDYLPARMINEYVYCPRLFYFEQVEGVFVDNHYTIEGRAQHRRVDKEGGSAPCPSENIEEPVIVRSITLSDDNLRVTAKLDLTEFSSGRAIPVDYKRGRPDTRDDGLQPWPSDRVQLAIQAIVLRANGYCCDEGVVYYRATKQRVRITFDDETVATARLAILDAWETAGSEEMPPPLVDSPKCPGCSLVGICMPDETSKLQLTSEIQYDRQLKLFESNDLLLKKQPSSTTRLLVAPRVDKRPLYLNSQGLRVGKSGDILRIKDRDKVVQEARINELCQVNLMGNIQVTTQAIQELCSSSTPICYFSQGGWFYGITSGLTTKNVMLRRAQFRLAEEPWFCRKIASKLISGKIQNQRTLQIRNHIEPSASNLQVLKQLIRKAEHSESIDELIGFEGAAARIYFGMFTGMIKHSEPYEENSSTPMRFRFESRNRRPPRDPVNALLSFGYALLTKDFTIACQAVGFDPMIGFLHQPRHGRPALALDLMEPMRPLIVDSAVLSAINTKMLSDRDFITAGRSVALTATGRKQFLRAYEARMDTLVTHPLFDYRVSYRRLLEIQVRLLAKVLEGELVEYPAFVTR